MLKVPKKDLFVTTILMSFMNFWSLDSEILTQSALIIWSFPRWVPPNIYPQNKACRFTYALGLHSGFYIILNVSNIGRPAVLTSFFSTGFVSFFTWDKCLLCGLFDLNLSSICQTKLLIAHFERLSIET